MQQQTHYRTCMKPTTKEEKYTHFIVSNVQNTLNMQKKYLRLHPRCMECTHHLIFKYSHKLYSKLYHKQLFMNDHNILASTTNLIILLNISIQHINKKKKLCVSNRIWNPFQPEELRQCLYTEIYIVGSKIISALAIILLAFFF